MDSVVHFEIPADDVNRAKKFYQDLFGWDIHAIPMQKDMYYMLHTAPTDDKGMMTQPGTINGGMMQRQFTGEPVVIVVNIKNLDESLAKAKSSGATVVMEKMKVMDMGLYARIKDTEGNTIGLWQDLKK